MGIILLVSSVSAIEKAVLLNGGDCGRATQFPGGLVVSQDPITTFIPISNNYSCLFSIQTYRPRQTARLVFDHLTLSPSNCNQVYIQIYDHIYANDSSKLLPPRICPGTNASTLEYISTGNWMTMRIVANVVGGVPPQVNFSASYASFTAKPCVRPDLETECTTVNRCIYNELLCDKVDACGDNSDESEQPPSNCVATTAATSTAAATGSSSGISPALAAILVLAAVCLITYVIYILMSFAWFSEIALSCLRACLQYALTKKKDKASKTKDVETKEVLGENDKAVSS